MVIRIKSLFSRRVKYIPWYIFKSPQRHLGFWHSIWLELSALFYWLVRLLFYYSRRRLRPVSICTGIKDRTDNYLKYVLPSILKMHHQQLVELSVYDCGSEDADRLKNAIKAQWKGKLVFRSEPQDFTRPVSFNHAIDQASNMLIFTADADMTLPVNLVEACNKYVSRRTVWFPVCYSLFENKPAAIKKGNGEWLKLGKGMFAATKRQFSKAGKYNTMYKTWGWEDADLWFSFFRTGIVPLRNRCRGLIHHWHPSLSQKTETPEHLKGLGLD